MEIDFLEDGRADLARCVLEDLPEWFGRADAVAEYVDHAASAPMFVARHKSKLVGYLSVAEHFGRNCEVHSMGVKREFHRQGCGTLLVNALRDYAAHRGFAFLSVKTLSEERLDQNYEATRRFYLKAGFFPFEELPDLWGEDIPCLVMVMAL